MANEDVVRRGRHVTVKIDAVERTHEYATTASAKRAYIRLMFSKAARQKFLGGPRRD